MPRRAGDPGPWPLPRGEAQAVLDREALRGLVPAAAVLGTVYAVFGFAHLVFLRPDARPVMVPLTWAEAAVLFCLVVAWRVRPPAPTAAHGWLLLVGLLALANSGTLLFLLAEPKQATNLVFLLVGGGYLLLRTPFFAAYAGLIVAVFSAAVARDPMAPDWTHYAFAVLSAMALAILVHLVRRRATLHLEGARMAAESSEQRLRTVLTGAPLVLFGLDREGRFTLVEGQGLARLGLKPGDLVGRSIFEAYAHNPRIVEAAREALAGRAQGTTVDEAGRLYDAQWVPLPGGGIVGVATDVTDRLRADEERARAAEQAQEAERLRALDRLRTQFINTAAHELNTPLTPIRLQLHLLEAGDPQARGKAAAVLGRNVGRLHRIVRDLLAMARLQEGRLAVRPGTCDLAAVARATLESFAEPARMAGVALRLEADGIVAAWAEDERVQQVLDNLVANAVKFTPRGGHVVVRVRSTPGRATVEVSDTGVGIDPPDLAALFQPFHQLEAGKERGGTGLGLHLSKAIVEAHGGEVEALSSGRGRGATFRFWLPAAPPA